VQFRNRWWGASPCDKNSLPIHLQANLEVEPLSQWSGSHPDRSGGPPLRIHEQRGCPGPSPGSKIRKQHLHASALWCRSDRCSRPRLQKLEAPEPDHFSPGDVLLLQSSADSLSGIVELLGCLPLAERSLKLGQAKNMILPLVIFALAIIGSALGLLPVEVAFVGAATVMVLMGILSLQEAIESIEW